MKKLWLLIGAGMAVIAVLVLLFMSGTVEAPGNLTGIRAPDGDVVEFEPVEETFEQREEAGAEFDGSVLTVYAGAKPTGGHGMEIDKIEETEDKLVVYVKEYEPGDGCIVTQAFTYPQATVRLGSQVDKPVDIVTERIVRDCQ